MRRSFGLARRVGAGQKGVGMTTARSTLASAGAMAACLLIAASPPAPMRVASVTDGDTFRLVGGERIRIAGIDAPETRADQADCPAEIVQGRASAAQVRALLLGRRVGIVPVGRSYARTVARVTLGGRDLARALVAIGAARWWPRGVPKPNWCGGTTRARRSGGPSR
ncbi:thermonuclease family protein [Sphingomonas sp. 1P08PE]|uniref:thermonuclease family protein n=1 Tax=Sphingomonas sp. 1P08PE TaxID=554122 RepID=UPI00399F069E